MAFRLRSERDPIRIAAILDYSLWQLSPLLMASTPWILVALLLMMFKP